MPSPWWRRWMAAGCALLAVGCGADDEASGVPDAVDVRSDASDLPDALDPSDTSDGTARVCSSFSPQRNLYFGDLHVHTALSFDAWINDVRTQPEDAYRFAQGAAVRLPPLGADGVGLREVQLTSPLDFAAVTDHAEYLAEIDACVTPDSAAYATQTCVGYRMGNDVEVFRFGSLLTTTTPERFGDVCGEIDCPEQASGVWARVVEAAERANDPCTFTSFVGYEWTGATGVSNAHRNVIFAGDTVPSSPTSYFEAPTPEGLWRALEPFEEHGVLVIPHNANMSDGQMFHPAAWRNAPNAGDLVARRARLERLLEVIQHKGDGECMNGLRFGIGATDELCDFEKLYRPPFRDCGDEPGAGSMAGLGCASPYDFLRGILHGGLALRDAFGENPYAIGVIGGTDTHNGTPGLVDEASYAGHVGRDEATALDRLAPPGLLPGGVRLNPGGLTAVWAEENTRESLFAALHRRETYSTSGPRMRVRFFGGTELPADLCEDAEALEAADATGVPMGGVLEAVDRAPTFWVLAGQDAAGVGLERLQIVKGWRNGDGSVGEEVVDLAVASGTLDVATCRATGGAPTLCASWTDPTWQPGQDAWYYARVVEIPTCRWSARDCASLPEADRPESCDDPRIPATIRERAVTSPIWAYGAR
jgi:hypothetical protein